MNQQVLENSSGIPQVLLERVQSIVRIRPGKEGESKGSGALQVEGSSIRLGRFGNFKYDKIYNQDSASQDIFVQSVQPMVSASLQGYNSAVLFFGETGSGKKSLFRGNSKSQGIVSLLISQLFSQASEKLEAKGFEVNLQMFQIVKDEILDLLEPKGRFHLTTTMTPDGVAVEHITQVPGSSATNLLGRIEAGVKNAHPELQDSGSLAQRATTCVILDVSANGFKSRILLMSLPGTEKLTVEAKLLRMREGPTLNNEVLALATVLNQMSNQQEASFCDFSTSKTTHLMTEALGGNCITLLVSTVGPYVTTAAAKTLEIAHRAKSIRNFPLPNDNTLRSLQRRLRKKIAYLRQLQVAADSQAARTLDQDAYDAKVGKMEQQLIQSDLKRAKLVDENHAMRQRFEQFREKFKAMMQSKVETQKRLLESEKERLRVSKALVDLKLEGSTSSEKRLANKHALEAKVLELEAELVRIRAQSKSSIDQSEKMTEELKTNIEENERLKIELVSVRHSFNEVRAEHAQTQKKYQRVSAELLTLYNVRKTLEKAKGDLEEQVHNFAAGKGLEVASKQDLDRWETEAKNKAKALAASQAEEAALRVELKKGKEDREELRKELTKVREDAQARSEGYRKEMAEAVVKGAGDDMSREGIGFAFASTKVYAEHVMREREILKQLVEQQTKLEALLGGNAELGKRYRVIRDYLRKASAPGEKWPGVLEEEDLDELLQASTGHGSNVEVLKTMVTRVHSLQDTVVDSMSKQAELEETKKQQGVEIKKLESEIKRLRSEVHSEDEAGMQRRSMGESEDTKNSVQQIREDTKKSVQQIREDTKNSIQQIQEYLDKMFKQKVENSTKPDSQKVLELEDKVAVLESKNEKLSKRASGGDPEAVNKKIRELESKDKEIKELKIELLGLREKVHELQKKQRAPQSQQAQVDTNAIRNELAAFSQTQLADLEAENSDMKSRLIQAESELENFQEYMKDQIITYQNQIIQLKKQLATKNQREASRGPVNAWSGGGF